MASYMVCMDIVHSVRSISVTWLIISIITHIILIYSAKLTFIVMYVSCIVPDYPAFNGTSCYLLTQDRRVGMANASLQLSLHNGWKSLAPVLSVLGRLSLLAPISIPGFPAIFISQKTYLETHAVEVSSKVSIDVQLQHWDVLCKVRFVHLRVNNQWV